MKMPSSVVLALLALTFDGPTVAYGQQPGPEISPLPVLELGAGAGGAGDQLGLVVGAARTPDGGFVVLDAMDAALKLYDARGTHVRDIGGRGDGPGEFRDPIGLVVIHDTLVVLDGRGRRTFLGPDGRVLRTDRIEIGSSCDEQFIPRFGGLLPDGGLIVRCEERLFGRVRGEYRQSVALLHLSRQSRSTSLGVFPGDTGRTDAGRVPVPRPYAPRRPLLWSAAGQRIFIAPSDGSSVFVHTISGEREAVLPLTLRDRPVSEDDIDEALAAAMRFAGTENDRRVVREWAESAPRAGRTPVVRSLFAARPDELWVESWEEADDRTRWSIIDGSGEHLRVLGPPNSELLAVGVDWTLWLWRDELDVEYVRLHRLRR